jgi:hypothetical protein
MVISIDGEEYPHLNNAGRTLGDLLKEVKASLAADGKMVVGILCDGNLLAPDTITTSLKQAVETFSTIEFQSSKPEDLARNSLDACRNNVGEIEGRIDSVVGKLQKSEVQSAMNELGLLFGCLNDTYRGLQGIFQLMKIDPQGVELSTGSAEKAMVGIVSQLKDIKAAIENHDYVQLADLFQYELGPTVKQWNQIIDNLLDVLDREK